MDERETYLNLAQTLVAIVLDQLGVNKNIEGSLHRYETDPPDQCQGFDTFLMRPYVVHSLICALYHNKYGILGGRDLLELEPKSFGIAGIFEFGPHWEVRC